MDVPENKELKQWMRKIWIIWAAVLYALYAYIKLCHFTKNDVPYFAEAKLPLEVIKYSLFVFTAFLLFFAYSYRKRKPKGQNIGFNQRILQRAQKMNKPPIFVKYSSDVISSLAITLCIGLFGLIYFFVSGDWQTFYIFIIISAIAITYFRPKLKEFERLLKNKV